MKTNNLKMIIQKIKDFELINNGISDALVDLSDVKIAAKEVICTITVYDDDFSSKNVYSGVVYPQNLFKNL